MASMTILEASEYFHISKEAIHNRIRRGSLSSEIVDGIKMVIIDTSNNTQQKPKTRTKSHQNDDRYYKLLEEQNLALLAKVEKLEGETRTLRDQKEQMLISERVKIEQIYKDKDEQLKNILQSIASQFMLNPPQPQEHLEAEIEIIEDKSNKTEDKIISLKKYLKQLKCSVKDKEKIIKKFDKKVKKDDRIILVDKKYYLNLTKYDYSDIIKVKKGK